MSSFIDEVERSLRAQVLTLNVANRDGLRVLEATDVRGLRFRAVFIAGMIEAGSQAEALKLIHDRGMLAFEAGEGNSPGLGLGKAIRERFSRRLQLAGRVALTRDLAMLLKAEVTVDQTLRILSEGGAKPAIRKVVQHCAEGVAAGQTLSAALKSSRGGFRADELAMIAAGEQNGSLAEVLDQLAKLLERRLELSHRLTSALIYPALLILMAIASIFVIITVLLCAGSLNLSATRWRNRRRL